MVVVLQTTHGTLDSLDNQFITAQGTADACAGVVVNGHSHIKLLQVAGLWYILIGSMVVAAILVAMHYLRQHPRAQEKFAAWGWTACLTGSAADGDGQTGVLSQMWGTSYSIHRKGDETAATSRATSRAVTRVNTRLHSAEGPRGVEDSGNSFHMDPAQMETPTGSAADGSPSKLSRLRVGILGQQQQKGSGVGVVIHADAA